MVLFALSLPAIIGVTGLVIDLTNLYTKRAIAQRAADAAALAGCMVADATDLSSGVINDDVVISESKLYAEKNGYSASQVSVDPHLNGEFGKVQVTVSRDEKVFFVPALEFLLGGNPAESRRVFATAVAQKFVDKDLSLGGNYGTTTGASNPSAFGPFAKHSYGDPYSVYFHDDGTLNDADPEHLKKNKGVGFDSTSHYNPDGFTYDMTVSKDFVAKNKKLRIQLYDPDGFISNDGESLDERHDDYTAQAFNGKTRGIVEATTEYTIYKVEDNGTLTTVKTISYGADQSVDAAFLKSQGKNPWITPDGFNIDLAQYGDGKYKIRVKTTDGSSENGYNLRAGPDYGPDYVEPEVKVRTAEEWNALETEWNNRFGDKGGDDPGNIQVPIVASGKLQMNFTRTAPVKVRMAQIPADAAGKELTVTKFDTDVGSNSINYYFLENSPSGSPVRRDVVAANNLDNRNDYWSQNQVPVPADFKGGYLFADYDAGRGDTSSWSIKYAGSGPGSVKLIK